MPSDPAPPAVTAAPAPLAAPATHPAPPPAGHHGPFHTHCENCGTALQGAWCHRCGQHDFEFHRSFRHVLLEALESLFHFEGKFFRNIVTLLFQPGRLTAEFNAGRRAAQMPPFRLYVFVSFLFFLLIFLGSHEAPAPAPAGSGPSAAAAPATPAERAVATPNPNRPAFAEFLLVQGRRAFAPENHARLIESFRHHLPHMLLLCLPLFALYTRVLFRRSGLVYLQHLVLALHFHTFIYLWVLCRNGWAALAGLTDWGWDGAVTFAGNLWLYAYPVLMLRRLFANSWPRTLGKAFALALGYGCTLGLVFCLTAILLLITL